MDDWKLKSTPVVRIERPNKTFVYAVPRGDAPKL